MTTPPRDPTHPRTCPPHPTGLTCATTCRGGVHTRTLGPTTTRITYIWRGWPKR
jgi:hypothetical protein